MDAKGFPFLFTKGPILMVFWSEFNWEIRLRPIFTSDMTKIPLESTLFSIKMGPYCIRTDLIGDEVYMGNAQYMYICIRGVETPPKSDLRILLPWESDYRSNKLGRFWFVQIQSNFDGVQIKENSTFYIRSYFDAKIFSSRLEFPPYGWIKFSHWY